MIVTSHDSENTIYVTGTINEEGFGMFCGQLTDYCRKIGRLDGGGTVTIVINSGGGKADVGFAMIDRIKELSDKHGNVRIATKATGFVGSMGFVLLLAGDSIAVTENAILHYHHGSYRVEGAVQDHIDKLKYAQINMNQAKNFIMQYMTWDSDFMDAIERERKEIYMDREEFFSQFRPWLQSDAYKEQQAKIKAEEDKAKEEAKASDKASKDVPEKPKSRSRAKPKATPAPTKKPSVKVKSTK